MAVSSTGTPTATVPHRYAQREQQPEGRRHPEATSTAGLQGDEGLAEALRLAKLAYDAT